MVVSSVSAALLCATTRRYSVLARLAAWLAGIGRPGNRNWLPGNPTLPTSLPRKRKSC